MRRLRSLRLVALSSAIIAVLFVAEAAAAVAEGYLVDQENAMVSLVNQHRSAEGLNTLRSERRCRPLHDAGDRMSAAGYIYHNPNLAAEAGAAVPSWLRIGENVGVGPNTDAVEDAFLASPHHRENIEGDYTMIGLGAVGGSGGVLYFTQNFAKSGRSHRRRPPPHLPPDHPRRRGRRRPPGGARAGALNANTCRSISDDGPRRRRRRPRRHCAADDDHDHHRGNGCSSCRGEHPGARRRPHSHR